MIVARNDEVNSQVLNMVEGQPVQGRVSLKPLIGGENMIMLEIQYPAGSGSPLHTHQHESLVYIVSGRVRAVVGGETYTLEAGDACRHPEDVPHSVEAIEDATILEIKSPPFPLEQVLGTS